VRSLLMMCSGVWRLRFVGLLLAKSGRRGSSHKGWFSLWGPRHPRQWRLVEGHTPETNIEREEQSLK